LQSILEIVRSNKSEGSPTAEDKLRLVLVFYLSSPDNALSKDDITELDKELKAAGADVSAFEFVRKCVFAFVLVQVTHSGREERAKSAE